MAKQKLYCYVDESGQDTKGKIFVVSVIVTNKDRDSLMGICEEIEFTSKKGKFKWGKAEHKSRLAYLRKVFSLKIFKGKLRFIIYQNTNNYDFATINGIAKAIQYKKPKEYTTLIYVDGLAASKRNKYGSALRRMGIPTRKVQGIAKDENNSLTRLADAIAGFVRDALEGGDLEIERLYKKATKDESLIEI